MHASKSLAANRSTIRAIFYDAGNTLLKPTASLSEVLSAACKGKGLDLVPETFDDALLEALYHSDSQTRRDSTFWGSEVGAREMWLALFGRVLSRVGVDGEAAAISRRVYDYFADASSWTTFPEVLPTLEAVRRRGIRQGIVSNWNGGLGRICQATGLADQVDFIVASGAVGRAKPYPHIFEVALGRARVPARACLHVGDQYHADILGARTVGIPGVLVYREGEIPRLDCRVVRSLGEIIPLLDEESY